MSPTYNWNPRETVSYSPFTIHYFPKRKVSIELIIFPDPEILLLLLIR